MAKESRARSAMSGGRKASGKRTSGHAHGMRIRRGKSGGFIAKHEQDPADMAAVMGGGGGEDEHAIPDLQALHNHIDQHFGDQPEAGAEPMQGMAQPTGM